MGYASLSVEENVQIIVPQILSHLDEIRADQKQQRTSDFPTFLLSLLNNSKYDIEKPYPDEMFKLIMARINQELNDNGKVQNNQNGRKILKFINYQAVGFKGLVNYFS